MQHLKLNIRNNQLCMHGHFRVWTLTIFSSLFMQRTSQVDRCHFNSNTDNAQIFVSTINTAIHPSSSLISCMHLMMFSLTQTHCLNFMWYWWKNCYVSQKFIRTLTSQYWSKGLFAPWKHFTSLCHDYKTLVHTIISISTLSLLEFLKNPNAVFRKFKTL